MILGIDPGGTFAITGLHSGRCVVAVTAKEPTVDVINEMLGRVWDDWPIDCIAIEAWRGGIGGRYQSLTNIQIGAVLMWCLLQNVDCVLQGNIERTQFKRQAQLLLNKTDFDKTGIRHMKDALAHALLCSSRRIRGLKS
jgi:hypothetical protein